jgi:DNA-binding IclR family transcriptional regulator
VGKSIACYVASWSAITSLHDERYYITLKIFELAHRNPPTQRLLTEARPVLQYLAHA